MLVSCCIILYIHLTSNLPKRHFCRLKWKNLTALQTMTRQAYDFVNRQIRHSQI